MTTSSRTDPPGVLAPSADRPSWAQDRRELRCQSFGMLVPFTLVWLLVILLVAFVPDLVLWLPRMIQGSN